MSKVTLTAWMVCAAVLVQTQQQPSLRQRAREGDVHLTIANRFSPADLSQIAGVADVVVLADVVSSDSMLSIDEAEVFTDIQVRVRSVLKRTGSPKPADGDTLVVRRWGGTMLLEGHRVTAEEDDFPFVNVEESYVLFLQRVEKESFYYFVYGAEGAFQIQDGWVRQLSTKAGTWNKDRGVVRIGDFVAEVRRLVSVKPINDD
jgi:hypothetical protein